MFDRAAVRWGISLTVAVVSTIAASGCVVGVKFGADGNELSSTDAATPDASMAVDGSSSETDSGITVPDSGETDSGIVLANDAGIFVVDSGPPPSDAGSNHADGGSPKDGGVMRGDGGAPPPGVDNCFEVELCTDYCANPTCKQRCLAMGTASAQQNYTGLVNCINTNCPSADGGVCDYNAADYDGGACSACQNTESSPNQPCFVYAVTCYPTQCAQNNECSAPAPYCDTNNGDFCVQCLTNAECGSGQACVGNVCQQADLSCISLFYCAGGCMAGDQTCLANCLGGGTDSARTKFENYMNCQDAVCPVTDGGVCDTTNPAYSMTNCNSCGSMAQQSACTPQIEACVENCGNSGDCTLNPATPACDTVTSTCVQCASNSDCQSGWICASNVCIQTCSAASPCPQGESCSNGICEAGP